MSGFMPISIAGAWSEPSLKQPSIYPSGAAQDALSAYLQAMKQQASHAAGKPSYHGTVEAD
jgi:hypothetical protein